jgi:4-(cytidine 5'-diphospho)-2-C-methyl-D-erythritol kinase
VATAKIFAHEGLTRDSKPSIMPTFQSLQPFQNDMQAVVFQEYSEVWKAYVELSQYGYALMTGSGACLFIASESHQEAHTIYQQVSQSYEAYCVEGLDIHPLFHMI